LFHYGTFSMHWYVLVKFFALYNAFGSICVSRKLIFLCLCFPFDYRQKTACTRLDLKISLPRISYEHCMRTLLHYDTVYIHWYVLVEFFALYDAFGRIFVSRKLISLCLCLPFDYRQKMACT
jgi:hypothetical protein